ncbi:uncharacterized protein LOC116732440 isoform X3 [Xiphophorus hellerii]|uniref:uncharacterized protein LOC116732440 isoform X3 n=1 Tax=Xiphophorus hellerii TaxID=8084 RepID=UPI0013B36D58|nr:uncharacterized protein LOC116732440 isoform X3 [Xiphophorus hellerii]
MQLKLDVALSSVCNVTPVWVHLIFLSFYFWAKPVCLLHLLDDKGKGSEGLRGQVQQLVRVVLLTMNMFRRDKGSPVQTPVVPPRPTKEELDNPVRHSHQTQDPESNAAPEQKTGVMGVVQKVNPFKSPSKATSSSSNVSQTSSSESLEQATDSTQNPGMLKGVVQKVNPFKSTSTSQVPKAPSSDSLGQERSPDSSQSSGVFKGAIQKVNPLKSSAQQPKTDAQGDPANTQQPGEDLQDKRNPGVMSSMIQKVNPFKSSQPKDARSLYSDSSSLGSGGLTDNSNVPEKQNPGMFKGMMQKVNPFKSHTQVTDDACETDSSVPSNMTEVERATHSENSSSSESLDDSAIERHTFIIKRILPKSFFGSGSKESANPSSAAQAQPQEDVEVQTLQLAEVPVPGEGTQLDPLDDEEGLLSWWKAAEGWDEWNEANQNDDAEEVVEQAADRVFMAARLFVRLFNQRGASLQQRILELLSLADLADDFHKKTVTASVGGGVASVAGSITTITGLILAPFTAGTSLIVTAVGIGIATAGGVTSASANITDTLHSKTDRKKVEKMIQDYQDEIKDIKDCLEFLQEGMATLEEWNFEKYAESISKKHLNQNVKHVMKEGGRAGKALVINTENLISTVQVLSVAGGAAKAAQVMSVTTGVMSGLFLALDVFFLAKDSMELRKGAKTEFAAKIREVCKHLQHGLLELNRIKEELQKTMDGIEVEVEEEEDMLKSDLKKLIELED